MRPPILILMAGWIEEGGDASTSRCNLGPGLTEMMCLQCRAFAAHVATVVWCTCKFRCLVISVYRGHKDRQAAFCALCHSTLLRQLGIAEGMDVARYPCCGACSLFLIDDLQEMVHSWVHFSTGSLTQAMHTCITASIAISQAYELAGLTGGVCMDREGHCFLGHPQLIIISKSCSLAMCCS